MEDEIVQYYIVNSELNMSAGKIAAQVGHVATIIAIEMSMSYKKNDKFNSWYAIDQPKIILRGKQKEMEELIEKGWYHILDLGRTEITSGSLTVIGCIPEYKSIMKPVVKRFQLL